MKEKFLEFINADEHYDKNEIRITEEFLIQANYIQIFVYIKYFLDIEDEKPVIFAHGISRMDFG